jgi:hypothetical protein
MSKKNMAVFGLFSDRESVEDAMRTLCSAGFRDTDISVLFQANQGTKDLGIEKHTKAPEGAAAGGFFGIVLGGALGWLVGSSYLTMPGLQVPATMDPTIVMLAGAGGLGLLGGFFGALFGMLTPEYEARRYNGRVKRGSILLSLHCDDSAWAKRAAETLRLTAAVNIGHARESAADFSVTEKPMPRVRKLVSEVPPSWPNSSDSSAVQPDRQAQL